MAGPRNWVVGVAVLASFASSSAAEPAGSVPAAVKVESDFHPLRSRHPLPVPFAVRSKEDAAKLFEEEPLRRLLADVDFSSQYVLVFAWNGSRYDELTVTPSEFDPQRVSFVLEKAMTADYAVHVEVYALRSDVRWGFSKSLEDASVGTSRLTTDVPWTPDGSGVGPEPEPDRVVYRLLRNGDRGWFVPDGRLELRTKKEALRYFSEADLAEVDFQKQYVLALSWSGSGRDVIRASYDQADPREVIFEIVGGFTADLRPHFRAYAIQSEMKWRVVQSEE